MPIDLREPKSEATRTLPPGHPGREALLAQPDLLPIAEFDALIPTLIRMLRSRT
ncbi:MAG: hypothetical protein L3K16_05780 [Thermoplasmata archaeon]|nr:hypothetical protein [Thermoplasmata archaeon]